MKNYLIIPIAITLLSLFGCSGNINETNYKEISNGMTLSEVEAILGKGKSAAQSSFDMGEFGGNTSVEVITWQDGSKVISISFTNGQVVSKAQVGL